MSGLETNLKSTRPRPGHYETKTETANKGRDRDRDLHHCYAWQHLNNDWQLEKQKKTFLNLHFLEKLPKNLKTNFNFHQTAHTRSGKPAVSMSFLCGEPAASMSTLRGNLQPP